MNREKAPTLPPSHMGFPGIQELAFNPKPELLKDYLGWLLSDEARLASVFENMQWYPPGFHGLLVYIARKPDDVTHTATMRLNFYHPAHPGDEVPHAHSRDAQSTWYAPPGFRQKLIRYQVLPDKASAIKGLNVEKRAFVAMNIGDAGNGKRPIYLPTSLGEALVLENSGVSVAPMGSQWFRSIEVHHTSMEGDGGVAISAYLNYSEEPAELSSFNGLTNYKSLNGEQAEYVMAERRKLELQMRTGTVENAGRLAATTTLFPEIEHAKQIFERPEIAPPSPEVTLMLLEGAFKTSEWLCK